MFISIGCTLISSGVELRVIMVIAPCMAVFSVWSWDKRMNPETSRNGECTNARQQEDGRSRSR